MDIYDIRMAALLQSIHPWEHIDCWSNFCNEINLKDEKPAYDALRRDFEAKIDEYHFGMYNDLLIENDISGEEYVIIKDEEDYWYSHIYD